MIPIAINKPWLLTGSSVLNLRKTKDTDIICYLEDITVPTEGDEWIRSTIIEGKRYEFLLADNQPSLQAFLDSEELSDIEIYYCLKAGHIHIAGRRQDNWEKHIHDLSILRLILGQERIQELEPYVKLHRKSTNQRIKQRTPRLKGVKKEEFFDDFVEKFIDHDLIHEEVAYDSRPAYTKMQKDSTVECHRDLWEQMSLEEQCQAVAEEASVIALERWQLPEKLGSRPSKPMYLSYKWALWRICTTLCSGWFRQFAIDNYFTILNMYSEEKLQTNLQNILNCIQTSKISNNE